MGLAGIRPHDAAALEADLVQEEVDLAIQFKRGIPGAA